MLENTDDSLLLLNEKVAKDSECKKKSRLVYFVVIFIFLVNFMVVFFRVSIYFV